MDPWNFRTLPVLYVVAPGGPEAVHPTLEAAVPVLKVAVPQGTTE